MGRLARVFVVAWLAAGCLETPGPSHDGGAVGPDASPEPGTTEWQVPLGESLPYIDIVEGDLLVAAGFQGTVPLDPPLTASGGGTDLLLAGFDASGRQRFAVAYGGPGDELPTAVSVSRASGEVGVIGDYLTGDGNVGGSALPAPTGTSNIFVARYAKEGTHQWSQAGTAEGGVAAGFVLSMSGGGALAFSGDYSTPISMDEASAPHSGSGYDLYFARVSQTGGVNALVGYGGDQDQIGAGALYDGLGSLYLFGTQTGPFIIDQFSPDADGDGGLFVGQIDDTGTDASWLFDSVGGSVGSLRGAVTPDGSLILTGWFEGTFAFDLADNEVLTSRGGSDVFIAVIRPDGTVERLEQLGGPGDDEPRGVAVGPDGTIAVTGSFRSQASIGDVTLDSKGGSDVFLISFAADRSLRWGRSFGDVEDDVGISAAVDGNGAVVLGTIYRGTVDFGGAEPLVAGGGSDGAVIRFR